MGLGQRGTVTGVCLSERRTDPKKNAGRGVLRPGVGLIGDAHAGCEREISLLSVEKVESLCREKGISAEPGCFAENISVCGIDTAVLRPGDRLEIGAVLFEVIGLGKDPSEPATYSYKGFSLLASEGIFCRVLEGGEIRVGDRIIVKCRRT